MNALFKTRPLQAANDFYPRSPSRAPRAVPLITLRKPKKQHPYGWIALVFVGALAGSGISFAGEHYGPFVMDGMGALFAAAPVSAMPEPAPAEPAENKPDLEATAKPAETITPPPMNAVAPVPITPILPKPALDEIAVPAAHLQMPDPPAPDNIQLASVTDPAIAAIAAQLPDMQPQPQKIGAQITIRSSGLETIDRRLIEAQSRLDAGDDDGALALYEQILAHDKNSRAALAGKAFALQRTSQYEAAVTTGRALLRLAPHDAQARVNFVAALGAWGTPEATNELQRMADLRPGYAPVEAALAQALAKQGDMKVALAHARRATQAEPDNILYRLDLAIVYDQAGDAPRAIASYRVALRAYEETDDRSAVLPISLAAIRSRVGYLETLIESANNQTLGGE